MARGRPRLKSHATIAKRYKNIEQSFESRQELTELLEHTDDPEGKRLLIYLNHPDMQELSLGKLCSNLKISSEQVHRLLTNSARAKAHLRGLIETANHVGSVVRGVGKYAAPQIVSCHHCAGSGDRENKKPCLECQGTGKLEIPGDTDKAKLVYEAAGLTGKGTSGFTFNQQINIPLPESLEEVVGRARKILETRRSEWPSSTLPESSLKESSES